MEDKEEIKKLRQAIDGVKMELTLLRKVGESMLTEDQAMEYRTRINRNADLALYLLADGR